MNSINTTCITVKRSNPLKQNLNKDARTLNKHIMIMTSCIFLFMCYSCAVKPYYYSTSDSELAKSQTKQLAKLKVHPLYSIASKDRIDNKINKINSDCGAYYDVSNKRLVNDDQCYARFWMNNLPDFNNPHEFILDFEFPKGLSVPENKYPMQIFLNNSPNGYTWIGIDQKGEILLSYREKDKGYTDIITSDNNYKIAEEGVNKLKFVQLPDGHFYFQINAHRIWSFDLKESLQKIPLVGLSNRIAFYNDVSIKKLEHNVLKPN